VQLRRQKACQKNGVIRLYGYGEAACFRRWGGFVLGGGDQEKGFSKKKKLSSGLSRPGRKESASRQRRAKKGQAVTELPLHDKRKRASSKPPQDAAKTPGKGVPPFRWKGARGARTPSCLSGNLSRTKKKRATIKERGEGSLQKFRGGGHSLDWESGRLLEGGSGFVQRHLRFGQKKCTLKMEKKEKSFRLS